MSPHHHLLTRQGSLDSLNQEVRGFKGINKKRKSLAFNNQPRSSASDNRYLKSQEVRGRRGEVFRHPDIATLSMDEIFSEMIRTSSGQELERRLSETLGMMEIKRAWTSSRLFADHPVQSRHRTRRSSSIEAGATALLTVTPEPPDRVQDGDGEEGRGATTDSGGWRTNLASLTSDIKHVLCDSYVKDFKSLLSKKPEQRSRKH